MAKIPLYNVTGEKMGELAANDAVFGVTPKASVVHQVYTAQMANAREPWADSKNRGEVRGGGKKPWAQKGTGRARHGSIRSPIWKGGGVAFGPLSIRNYKQKINKKMNHAAVRMVLSDKVASGMCLALESMPDTGKTKDVSTMLRTLPSGNHSTLILVSKMNDVVSRAVSNVKKATILPAKDASVVDLLHHKYVVFAKDGVAALEKRLA